MLKPTISASVGKGGVNRSQDVITVQKLINQNIKSIVPIRPLKADGRMGPKTIFAIEAFQKKVVGLRIPNGRVDPRGKTITKLTSSSQTEKVTHGIDDSELTKDRSKLFWNAVNRLKLNNKYFAALMKALQNSNVIYKISIGKRPKLLASFRPNQNNLGGSIDFSSLNISEDSALEEFFHAFQNQYYVNQLHRVHKLAYFGANVEFEAKFFKIMVTVKLNRPLAIFPDVEGLDSIAYDLVASSSYQLNNKQKQQYFKILHHFRQYHKNQKEQIQAEGGNPGKDIYDGKLTKMEPDAAFEIIKRGDGKK